ANAVWKNEKIKKEIMQLVKKEVERECTHLCSKKNPSCLRKTDKEDMLDFSMEKLCSEVEDRAPMLHIVLSAAAINRRSRAETETPATRFGAVGMAAAVCLRNRSRYMIAVQFLITNFLYHSNWLASLARLSTLRITTSHTYLYKKLDEFGKDHDKPICEAVARQSEYMASVRDHPSAENEDQRSEKSNKSTCHTPDCGRKVVFDNLDYSQEVHWMTEDHQNTDCHCVTAMSTENRVPGMGLSTETPQFGLLDMENGDCLPSALDNAKQQDNYVKLVERIIVNSIPCLEYLATACTNHIPHQYSGEMRKKTDTVFLGMIYENENDADGILRVLQELHQYVPFDGDDDERVYGQQGVVGDQLSVERGVNGHCSLANGFTPEERLEGLHFEIADWHGGNKFTKVAFSNLFNGASAGDKCTMYSDRNLVNRRNVKGDVTAAANACCRFLQLEVETQVVAAAMEILGMSSLDDEKPTKNAPPDSTDATDVAKKSYLRRIASLVVDTYVIDQQRNLDIQQSVQIVEHEQGARQQEITVDREGRRRFKCRAPGCNKDFAHDGKLRRDHEAKHNSPVAIDQIPARLFVLDTPVDDDDGDDMLSYQKALLDYGMIVINFWDAISEGDGQRVIRRWKFFLMYLKHQGGSAT
ncbi:unnamed protein product, partial [Porites evermanni]